MILSEASVRMLRECQIAEYQIQRSSAWKHAVASLENIRNVLMRFSSASLNGQSQNAVSKSHDVRNLIRQAKAIPIPDDPANQALTLSATLPGLVLYLAHTIELCPRSNQLR